MAKGERGTAKPYLRDRVWWIKYYVPGEKKPRRESSKSTSKTIAVRLLNPRRAEVDRGAVVAGEPSVGSLLELYLADQVKHRRRSLQDAKTNVPEHLQPAFGKLKARRFTSRLVDIFVGSKRWTGYSDASSIATSRG
jgi:hypothetical protein